MDLNGPDRPDSPESDEPHTGPPHETPDQRAHRHAREGRPGAARALGDLLAQADPPRTAEALQWYGEAHLQGDPEAAPALAHQLSVSSGRSAEAQNWYAQVLREGKSAHLPWATAQLVALLGQGNQRGRIAELSKDHPGLMRPHAAATARAWAELGYSKQALTWYQRTPRAARMPEHLVRLGRAVSARTGATPAQLTEAERLYHAAWNDDFWYAGYELALHRMMCGDRDGMHKWLAASADRVAESALIAVWLLDLEDAAAGDSDPAEQQRRRRKRNSRLSRAAALLTRPVGLPSDHDPTAKRRQLGLARKKGPAGISELCAGLLEGRRDEHTWTLVKGAGR